MWARMETIPCLFNDMGEIMFSSIRARAALAALALAAPMAAAADPVTWTLSGVTFPDGGTASGSFVYDEDTNLYSAVNVITTSGTTRLTGANYVNNVTNANPPSNASNLTMITASGYAPGAPYFVLTTSPKTDTGGTLAITGGFEGTCNAVPCFFAGPGASRNPSGSITTTPGGGAAAVPTLSEWAMILFGTLLAGGAALYIQRRQMAV